MNHSTITFTQADVPEFFSRVSEGRTLKNITLQNMLLPAYKGERLIAGITFENCHFQNVKVSGVDFLACHFLNCTFSSFEFGCATYTDCAFSLCQFKNIRLGMTAGKVVTEFVRTVFHLPKGDVIELQTPAGIQTINYILTPNATSLITHSIEESHTDYVTKSRLQEDYQKDCTHYLKELKKGRTSTYYRTLMLAIIATAHGDKKIIERNQNVYDYTTGLDRWIVKNLQALSLLPKSATPEPYVTYLYVKRDEKLPQNRLMTYLVDKGSFKKQENATLEKLAKTFMKRVTYAKGENAKAGRVLERLRSYDTKKLHQLGFLETHLPTVYARILDSATVLFVGPTFAYLVQMNDTADTPILVKQVYDFTKGDTQKTAREQATLLNLSCLQPFLDALSLRTPIAQYQ